MAGARKSEEKIPFSPRDGSFGKLCVCKRDSECGRRGVAKAGITRSSTSQPQFSITERKIMAKFALNAPLVIWGAPTTGFGFWSVALFALGTLFCVDAAKVNLSAFRRLGFLADLKMELLSQYKISCIKLIIFHSHQIEGFIFSKFHINKIKMRSIIHIFFAFSNLVS
jgi:hypothetical protein